MAENDMSYCEEGRMHQDKEVTNLYHEHYVHTWNETEETYQEADSKSSRQRELFKCEKNV